MHGIIQLFSVGRHIIPGNNATDAVNSGVHNFYVKIQAFCAFYSATQHLKNETSSCLLFNKTFSIIFYLLDDSLAVLLSRLSSLTSTLRLNDPPAGGGGGGMGASYGKIGEINMQPYQS